MFYASYTSMKRMNYILVIYKRQILDDRWVNFVKISVCNWKRYRPVLIECSAYRSSLVEIIYFQRAYDTHERVQSVRPVSYSNFARVINELFWQKMSRIL